MLTDKSIRAVQPQKDAFYISDETGRRGFGQLQLKVSSSGTKAFYFVYYFNKKKRFLALGDFPGLSLQEARKLATNYGQLVFDGKDPREVLDSEKQIQDAIREAERIQKLEGDVSQLLKIFNADVQSKRGKAYSLELSRTLNREALPVLGKTKVNQVTSEQIASILRPIVTRGSLVMANRTRSYLHAAFEFALKFDFSPERKETDPLFNLKFNPVTPVPKSLKTEQPSDRALSESELAIFWNLIEKSQLHPERKILLKLLIVFGGRRVNEVIQAPWSEFDLNQGLWDRPAARDKKGHHVLMPIGRIAHELLTELQQYTGESTYLFGDTPPTDYAINQTVRRLIAGKMEHFTPKSLRATAKTLMGKIGISKEARDRYHSHALTDVSSKHYDKFDYLEQNREVVRRWEAMLTDLLNGNTHQPGLKVAS